jgi:hypothetical protein
MLEDVMEWKWMWESWGNENLEASVPSTDCGISKQLDNVEYLKYFDSMITNDARCGIHMELNPGLP